MLVVGSEIPDQNYLVGSGPSQLAVPTYTIVPLDADVSLSYSVASTPAAAFITTFDSGAGVWKVQIDTADTSHTGIYTVDLTFTDAFSTLTRQTQFIVTVSCVQTID